MRTEITRRQGFAQSAKSRISWGAVFTGLFTAFVITMILEALGVAVGLSGDNSLGTGTVIWSVIVALLALFSGGWVMARTEAIHLNKLDLAIHGITLWGVLFFSLLLLTANGVQLGLSSILGAASSVANLRSMLDLQGLANQLNLNPEQLQSLEEWAQSIAPNAARSAWWGFFGLIASLIAVVTGAMSGQPSVPGTRHVPVETRHHGAA